MSKPFRPYEPDQDFLMPASMREWLPGDHLAYFISDIVDQLDLSLIMERYAGEERGYPPYHPAMMVKVLLYAYCIGVPSSRKIEKRLCEDIAFRLPAANNTPDFRTISDFRKDHLKALAGLFLQVLKLCQKTGMVKLGHVALDGTKIKANASQHKAMSYRRMKEEEARLEAEVAALMKQAEATDEAEDYRYGKDKRGDEIPQELAFRESRLKKIREAREALEEEAKRELLYYNPENLDVAEDCKLVDSAFYQELSVPAFLISGVELENADTTVRVKEYIDIIGGRV